MVGDFKRQVSVELHFTAGQDVDKLLSLSVVYLAEVMDFVNDVFNYVGSVEFGVALHAKHSPANAVDLDISILCGGQ